MYGTMYKSYKRDNSIHSCLMFLTNDFLFDPCLRRMSTSERCEAAQISSLVQRHVPNAKLSRQHEAEMTFTLPFESMDTFSGRTSRPT